MTDEMYWMPFWNEEDVRKSHASLPRDLELEVEEARYSRAIPVISGTDTVRGATAKMEAAELLLMARSIGDAGSLDDWQRYTSTYPQAHIERNDSASKSNIDARRLFLANAIERLLTLCNAPNAMRNDFNEFWGSRRAAHSDIRAIVQWLKHVVPTLSYRQAERATGYSRANIARDVKSGALKW